MKRSTFLFVAAMVLATNAFAVETTAMKLGLNDQIMSNSELMMSPAQLINFDKSKADLTLSQSNLSGKLKGETNDYISDSIKGSAYYRSEGAPFVFGVVGKGVNLKNDDNRPDTTDKRTVVQPEFAYMLPANITVGVSYAGAMDKYETSGFPDEDISYGQTRVGAMWQWEGMEVGVAHATEVDKTKDSNDFYKERHLPGKTTLHGRYTINRNLAFGAAVSDSEYVNKDEYVKSRFGKDRLADEDKVSGKAFVEVTPLEQLKVEGIVSYKGAADADLMTDRDDVNSTGVEANVIYRPTQLWEAGGGLAYNDGSRTYTNTDLSKTKKELTETKVSVFGGVRF